MKGWTVMSRQYRNPLVTVDIIIEMPASPKGDAVKGQEPGILLIERRNPPRGWALPGGFVDYGESLETAAVREAMEETSLEVTLLEQFHTYSAPDRDPRHHTVTTVYIGRASGIPKAMDDARNLQVFRKHELPADIVFDHARIIRDYYDYRAFGKKPDSRVPAAESVEPSCS
ncbi:MULTISPECIES: NUDIX domain-containing protein [Desulfococcus]|uniref:NUDIX hydrolase n=2 Tax=Desulfococcus multivorans TaxID=897 RepID=S7TBQ8_DESML|nr:NUDIX hydrolase [Desulfococcus multivorans]AQV02987.2 NUDIX hydrolase [Desulfococcus multivorans]EPR34061.1 NUDIX hydrolase [Desulfococcus multivorans DSM 2059]SJZ52907.1 8-oxo-dGTP diphosphatase [Desulfococcus multivorans DSM 2059]